MQLDRGIPIIGTMLKARISLPGEESPKNTSGARVLVKCYNLGQLIHETCPTGLSPSLCQGTPSHPGGHRAALLTRRVCEAEAQGSGLALLWTEV